MYSQQITEKFQLGDYNKNIQPTAITIAQNTKYFGIYYETNKCKSINAFIMRITKKMLMHLFCIIILTSSGQLSETILLFEAIRGIILFLIDYQ